MSMLTFYINRAGANLDELLSALSCFPYGARFDVMDVASIHLRPTRELIEELRRMHAEEKGNDYWDLVVSKKPF